MRAYAIAVPTTIASAFKGKKSCLLFPFFSNA